MKLIIAFIIAFSSMLTFAQDTAWVKTSLQTESANTNPEMSNLVQKYNYLFEGYIFPPALSRVFVVTYIYEFSGSHSCELNDPRLINISYAFGTCSYTTLKEECSYVKQIAPTSVDDPCAE